MASTRLGDAPRIENTGSTSWKPLRSSSGHALDDDDDRPSYRSAYVRTTLSKAIFHFVRIPCRSTSVCVSGVVAGWEGEVLPKFWAAGKFSFKK